MREQEGERRPFQTFSPPPARELIDWLLAVVGLHALRAYHRCGTVRDFHPLPAKIIVNAIFMLAQALLFYTKKSVDYN
jgi:hypothetical protein